MPFLHLSITGWQRLFLTLPVFLTCVSSQAQGTIVFRDPPDISLFLSGTYNMDLDGDGQVDFRFQSTQGEFRVFPRGDNAVLSRRNSPPDISRYCTPLQINTEINSLSPVGISWVPLETILGYEIGSTFTSCRDAGCLGDFTGLDAYLGIRFYIGNDLHYGWVRISVPYVGVNGGYIHEWAYETRPDTSILAGAVPEPSTAALLALGSLPFFIRRKRK